MGAPSPPGASFSLQSSPSEPLKAMTLTGLSVPGTCAYLEAEIIDHLDKEWIERDCHRVSARGTTDIYKEDFEKWGPDFDVNVLMSTIGEQLPKRDGMRQAFFDSDVNAWDISNLVSDLLIWRITGEGCDCNWQPSGVGMDAVKRLGLE